MINFLDMGKPERPENFLFKGATRVKKLNLILAIVMLLSLLLATAVSAEELQEPVGGCPDSFELMMMHDHDGDEHMHHHVGNDKDQNGDGWLCMKYVGRDGKNHVHTDNNVPLG
jgi:hypothetical protein